MGMGSEAKKATEGRGLLGLALGVAIGTAILTPLVAMLFNKIMSLIKRPSA